MIRKIYIFLFGLFLLGCNGKSSKNESANTVRIQSHDFFGRDIDTCNTENEILSHGILSIDYWFDCDLPERFPYALLLANKYNQPEAMTYIYEQIYSGYNYPTIYKQIVDDSIANYISNISIDTIKCPRSENRFKCCKYSEMEFLTKLSLSGYFRKKQYYIPDSISFNFAFDNLKKSAEMRVDISAIIDMYYIYFAGYGVNVDRDVARYWFNKYMETLLKRNTLNEIKLKRIELKAAESQLVVRKNKNNKISGVTTEAFESIFPKKSISKIEEGNIEAYTELKKMVTNTNSNFEILLFSIIMANKYHYPPAYLDSYIYIWEVFNYNQKKELWDLSSFDLKTKSFALYHLKKSASLKNTQAIEILKRIKDK